MALNNGKNNMLKYTVYRMKKDDDLLHKVKLRALQEGVDVIDIVEFSLRAYLKTKLKKIQRGAK